MAELRVSFPSPCSESWDEMAPNGCDRHCASCDTLVHDLAKLTADQIDSLFEGGKKVCVRAELGPGGIVKTSDRSRSNARPVLACAGAMLAVACQTTPGGKFEGGYQLSGQVYETTVGKSRIRNSEGQSVRLIIGRDGRFDVHGLRPGKYSLEILDYCGAKHEFADINIADRNVDLGRLALPMDCIIVGHMVRENDEGLG